MQLNTVRDTINSTSRTWRRDTFILITAINILLSSVTCTTWKLFSTLLVLSKSLLTMSLFPEVEEDFCSFSSILGQSTQFPDSEDGQTTNGSEEWSSIMSIYSHSTWDISKLDTLLTSLDLSLQSSTTFTLIMKLNNSPNSGPMSLKRSSCNIWDTQRSSWNSWDLTLNMTLSRKELSLTI